MVRIIGAVGEIHDVDLFLQRMLELAEAYQIIIQVVNADLVYGKDHLISAVNHANRAFKQGRNSTNSLAMEILLYASGERQIQKAIKKLGITKDSKNIAFVFEGEFAEDVVRTILDTLNVTQNDKVLEGDSDTLKKFGFTKKEIETVPKISYSYLILEKVAMVDVIK